MDDPALITSVLACGFLAGVTLTFVFMKVAQRANVLDVPNERSSHTLPVPRGGGLAIVVAFLVFLFGSSIFGYLPVDSSVRWALVSGGLIIAAVGVLDDLSHVPAKWRFLTHLIAVVIALNLLPSLPSIAVLGAELESQLVVLTLLTLGLIWFVNLYNFMDGIDGIAGVEAITASASAALILTIGGEHDWTLLLGFLGACIAGFLVWNWAPAKVFMGDGCSGFLGFTLGLIAISTSTSDAINVWSWLILFGVFIADSTTTLVVRVIRGEEWYAAHRSHAYQILSRRWHSHWKVSVVVLLVNLIWLLPLAYFAATRSRWALPLCLVALLPLVAVAVTLRAGRPDS